jgi:hypothetical protein
VHPEQEYDARCHHNGPGANRTIDALTMINVMLFDDMLPCVLMTVDVFMMFYDVLYELYHVDL